MRTYTIAITADFRFVVNSGIECVAGKSAYILLGTKSAGEVRIPVGMDFARSLPEARPCPKDGDGSLGLCHECGTMISRQDVRTVVEEVGFFKQERPTAKHGGVRVMNRANTFLTRKGGSLMVAEERGPNNNEVMVLFKFEGGSPQIHLADEENARKVFHKQAVRFDGRTVVGLDAFMVLRAGDKVELYRSSEAWHEHIVATVTDDLQVKLTSAARSEVAKNEPAPVEEPEAVEEAAEEAQPEEELVEEESSEIKFE